MYKSLCFLIILLLNGCKTIDNAFYIADDNGIMRRTLPYDQDRRGETEFPVQIAAIGKKQFIFDPKVYAWAAYDEQGKRLLTGSASGGQDYCDENHTQSCRTVVGTFKVYNKKGEDCRSGEYPVETEGGAKMPYCMYFFRGYTIHAAFEVPAQNTSHGCVRVLPSAAKWLNEEFMNIGTQVVILPYATRSMSSTTV